MIDFFFFNDTATTEIYTLSLHDALPISQCPSLDLCGIKSKLCGPHTAYLFFSVGLRNPHSHPRTLSSWVTIAKVALLFIAVSPTAGLHTVYYHSMACGWLIPILSGHMFLSQSWRPTSAWP